MIKDKTRIMLDCIFFCFSINKFWSRTKNVAFLVAASHLQNLQKTTTNRNFFRWHRSPALSCFNNIVFHSSYILNICACTFHVLPRPQFLGGFLHDLHNSHNNRLRRLHSKLLHRRPSFPVFLAGLLHSLLYLCCSLRRN